MSRETVLAERPAQFKAHWATLDGGHSTGDPYLFQPLLALVTCWELDGRSPELLGYIDSQWTYIKSFINGYGFIVLPYWVDKISPESSFRSTWQGILAARVLRRWGQSSIANEIIAALDAQARGFIDRDATWLTEVSSLAPYEGASGSIYHYFMEPVAPFSVLTTGVWTGNWQVTSALAFAMLMKEPTSSFYEAGAYRTAAEDRLTDAMNLTLAYQDASGAIPQSSASLYKWDTNYATYTVGMVGLLMSEMGVGWALYDECQAFIDLWLDWYGTNYGTEPDVTSPITVTYLDTANGYTPLYNGEVGVGGNYILQHDTAPEPAALEPLRSLLGIASVPNIDLPYTDRFIDQTTRMPGIYSPVGSVSESGFLEQSMSWLTFYADIGNIAGGDFDLRLSGSTGDFDIRLQSLVTTRRRQRIALGGV